MTYASVFKDDLVLKVATVTKLSRNLCLAGVIPYLTVKSQAVGGDTQNKTVWANFKQHTPYFVYGFIGMSLVRSVGDVYLAEEYAEQWPQLVSFVGGTIGSKLLLGTAMMGVGMSTSFKSLKGVGAKPFLLGFIGASTVGLTGLASSYILTSLFI